jgi:predicted transcriptional regulator of viral defense system
MRSLERLGNIVVPTSSLDSCMKVIFNPSRLAAVLRAAKEVVSVDVASKALGIERRTTAKLLSRWTEQGWLRRIGYGIFALHNVKPSRLFGLKTLWRGSVKVSLSDAARTLVDMISTPEVSGGIDHVADCLSAYLGSKSADLDS